MGHQHAEREAAVGASGVTAGRDSRCRATPRSSLQNRSESQHVGHTMESRTSPRFALLLSLTLLLTGPPGAAGKGAAVLKIEPGPTVMSPDEQAIREDPAAGIEHAVILLEETVRNENLGIEMKTRHHARIKILSNEARDLADIEIPILSRDVKLKEWWGRVILPGGEVLSLPREQLEVQSIARAGRAEAKAYKAALPGVVPGCVIDYGYELREAGYYPYDHVALQRRYLVREVRFRWIPTDWLPSAYYLSRTENLDIKSDVSKQDITVIGRNLPPVVEEPLMPPDHAVRAALILYYLPLGTEFDDYWEDRAEGFEAALKDHAGNKSSVQKLIEAMQLPEQGGLDERLTAAYEWMGANITRTGLRSFEEIETDTGDDEARKRDRVAALLSSRSGSRYEIHQAFTSVARALGAEANLLLVADRNEAYFNPSLKTMRQFDGTLVAVRHPGQSDEEAVPLDPCSGLSYGEVPWWYTGTYGMLVAKSQPRGFLVKSGTATGNVSDVRLKLSFSEDNETLLARWTQHGKGQVGLEERRRLRGLSPERRAERIDRLCGAAPERDILRAEVAGLDELARDLELSCETESWDTGLDEEVGRYNLGWGGPWLRGLPDLPEGPRTHMVVFDFPRTDVLTVEVTAPQGFVPDEPPPPVVLERRAGQYGLQVTRTDEGFTLQRVLVVFPLALPPQDYPVLRAFFDEVRVADRAQLTFTRAEPGR